MSNFVTEGSSNPSVPASHSLFSRWIKFLMRPSRAGFESIRDVASTRLTLVGLTVAWELHVSIGILIGIQNKAITTLLWAPIFNIVTFYLSQFAIWIGAKILSGTGKFVEQSNLLAITAIPVTIVDGLFDFARLTPLYEDAGRFLEFRILFKLYYLITVALATQVIHNISAAKAWTIAIVLAVFYGLLVSGIAFLVTH